MTKKWHQRGRRKTGMCGTLNPVLCWFPPTSLTSPSLSCIFQLFKEIAVKEKEDRAIVLMCVAIGPHW